MIARFTAIALGCGALAATALAAPAPSPAKPAKTTAVGLGLREYRITVYRSSVRTGRVTFNSKNFGEDAHDVRVTGPGGFDSGVRPEVAPFGGTGRFTVNLKRPGRYRLVCTLAGHEALGMSAELRVKKRRKAQSKRS